ncbi:hypothetical protein [Streptococcus acidominimus]|uniref:Uncharacterized protein n=1 Tax=Streptococcus acidominimus TaxID=1326 RepID=A0A4Y9FM38_STRAI|nr:hypothetical protein [Streptococcus acidominimus]MBF0819816.1 hypothetical protein [Streptococcus acidominimus]MBF0838893.1 hypothetical protein [Streptococcus acidominimus]MBF0847627.1 hypothetical protein [Streptococcus danieliae]TFU29399.1 hypothetical protein E4U01_10215 [Streptococcus acidominimus]
MDIEINSDNSLSTTLSVRRLEELTDTNANIGLNPISRFKSIERATILEGAIDVSQIKVTYLEDQHDKD